MEVFRTARWRLTLWYMVISLVLLTIFTIAALLAEQQAFLAVRELVHSEVRGIVFNAILQAEIDNFEQEFIRRLIIFDFLMLIIAGLASYILSGRTLEPIEKMVREQEAFAADASHELRTPLATIAMEIEARKRDDIRLRKADRELLDSIQAEVSRMRSIVAGLLSLVRTQEVHEMERAEVDLTTLAEDVLAGLRIRIQEKKIVVNTDYDEKVIVQGQFDDLRQVLLILLDNAILYTPAGGEISVIIRNIDKKVSIIVRNTGVSIPRSELSDIFNRFYRGKGVTVPGTGLGLAIARKIVERHHGAIGVASQSDATGVTFRIQLPQPGNI